MSKITIKRFITFKTSREELGYIDATFDLSRVPPELKHSAIRKLKIKEVILSPGAAHAYFPDKYPKRDFNLSILKRISNWILKLNLFKRS